MLNYIFETISSGIIMFVICTILFNLTINKENSANNNKYPIGINLSFFLLGVVLYFILDYIN